VLAEADSPLGPFKEIKAPWFDPGRQTIDAHVFRDDDGQLYLYAVQLGRPFNILVRKLDSTTLAPSAEATFCIRPTEKWEGDTVNEGPFVVKHDGAYFLTYSAHGFDDPDYCVGVATSKSPLGPWKKRADGPILIRPRAGHISGTGHHCFVESPDGKELFIGYHTHQQPAHPSGERELAIDRAHFVDSPAGPTIKIGGPTDTMQPMPSGSPPLVRGQSDELDGKELDRSRWTIFNEDSSHWSLTGGKLVITTQDGDVYRERADLKNLFLQYPPAGDFDVTASIVIKPERNHDQAFVCLWQDHNDYTKLAVVYSDAPKLEVATETDGDYQSQLFDLPSPAEKGVQLRLRRHADQCEYLFSADGQTWKTLATKPMKLIDLRVGIGAASPASDRETTATFDFVHFAR
jgi:beta-xylosidase